MEQYNFRLDHVEKCTVILKDSNDFTASFDVYKSCFPMKPARTTCAVSGWAVAARIEIVVITVQ